MLKELNKKERQISPSLDWARHRPLPSLPDVPHDMPKTFSKVLAEYCDEILDHQRASGIRLDDVFAGLELPRQTIKDTKSVDLDVHHRSEVPINYVIPVYLRSQLDIANDIKKVVQPIKKKPVLGTAVSEAIARAKPGTFVGSQTIVIEEQEEYDKYVQQENLKKTEDTINSQNDVKPENIAAPPAASSNASDCTTKSNPQSQSHSIAPSSLETTPVVCNPSSLPPTVKSCPAVDDTPLAEEQKLVDPKNEPQPPPPPAPTQVPIEKRSEWIARGVNREVELCATSLKSLNVMLKLKSAVECLTMQQTFAFVHSQLPMIVEFAKNLSMHTLPQETLANQFTTICRLHREFITSNVADARIGVDLDTISKVTAGLTPNADKVFPAILLTASIIVALKTHVPEPESLIPILDIENLKTAHTIFTLFSALPEFITAGSLGKAMLSNEFSVAILPYDSHDPSLCTSDVASFAQAMFYIRAKNGDKENLWSTSARLLNIFFNEHAIRRSSHILYSSLRIIGPELLRLYPLDGLALFNGLKIEYLNLINSIISEGEVLDCAAIQKLKSFFEREEWKLQSPI